MSDVLDILARMHHINALPATIYNYSPAKDRSVVQRPPTLYLLSARIMTRLSDVAWKKHWSSEMQKAKGHGYELPEPRAQPQLPQVGAEVWLDLVLWACVEGGWVSEAAWIISEMQNQNRYQGLNWSVIGWDEICQTKSPKLGWTAILKLQIDKSRLNQSTGIQIANSGISSVDMGSRTISREAVSAVLDGIINRASAKPALYGSPIETIQKHTLDCIDLLNRGQMHTDANFTNAMVLRMVELATLEDMHSLKFSMTDIVTWIPILSDPHPPDYLGSQQTAYDSMDNSACILGLLHRILHDYSVRADYHGILGSLETIQNLIDGNRNGYIQEFADELRERLRQGQEDSNSSEPYVKKTPPMLHPHIPVHVMSQLLDTVAQNKFTKLGQWILYNNDVDGGILPSQMYRSTALQPALLDFATATTDDVLLNKVLEQLQPPLSQSILHALLRCQIALDKWPAVQDILHHFKNSKDTEWHSSDALSVAAAVLRLDRVKLGQAGAAHPAQLTLMDILRGRFNHPQDPSAKLDLSKIQEANQLKRLLRSVPGNRFDFLTFEPIQEAARLSSKCQVPASAFSILLEEVVKQLGSRVGKSLWQRWCVPLSDHEARMVTNHDTIENSRASLERVVVPTVSMLRSIIRQSAHKIQQQQSVGNKSDLYISDATENVIKSHTSRPNIRRNDGLTDEDIHLLRWAVPLYRNFGFNKEAIERELPNVHTLL